MCLTHGNRLISPWHLARVKHLFAFVCHTQIKTQITTSIEESISSLFLHNLSILTETSRTQMISGRPNRPVECFTSQDEVINNKHVQHNSLSFREEILRWIYLWTIEELTPIHTAEVAFTEFVVVVKHVCGWVKLLQWEYIPMALFPLSFSYVSVTSTQP